jgi:hypothetical protein
VQDSRGEGIVIKQSYTAQVYGNVITGVKCDSNRFSDGGGWTTWQGIKVGQGDGKGAEGPHHHVIHDNVIANFDLNCDDPNGDHPQGGGIWCDSGVTHGEVYNNRVINVAPRFGVQIESRCHHWSVHDNIVSETRGKVKPNYANYQTRNATGTRFQNNISCSGNIKVGSAFLIKESPDTLIHGNIIAGARKEIETRSKGKHGQTTINGVANTKQLPLGNRTVGGVAAPCQKALATPLVGSCGMTPQ